MIGEIRAAVADFDRAELTLRVSYNPQLDEDVLVVRVSTAAGFRWNRTRGFGVRVYDPRVLPLANDTVQGIYRMHLVDRHTPK